MTVTNTTAAMTVTAVTVATAVRFPLRQVARHRLLSPAPSTGRRRRCAVSCLPGVILGQGQVQGQGKGKAGLLLHE